MMETSTENSEQTILDAAKKIFISNGYAGAHMQAIADCAGVNKALVHYYYRNKQKLFDRVFENVLETVIAPIIDIFAEQIPLLKKIERFINAYIDTLKKNPYIPIFMLHELSANKALVLKCFERIGKQKVSNIMPELVMNMAGTVKQGDPRQLLVNFISMLIFPFVGRDLFSQMFDFTATEYDEFLEERKTLLYKLVKDKLSLKEE